MRIGAFLPVNSYINKSNGIIREYIANNYVDIIPML